jgi:hypothetical protein
VTKMGTLGIRGACWCHSDHGGGIY